MEILKQIDLSLYSQLILIYLLVYNLRIKTREKSTKLFISIVIALFINNTLELSSWILRGKVEFGAYYINYFMISILLALNSVPVALWIKYIDYKIFKDYQKAKKRFLLYLIPFYISSSLVIINFFTGIVFTLTPENLYSRNFGVYIITSLSIIMVVITFFLSLRFKKEIQGRVMESIFLFMLIPLSAGLTQIIFFGIPLIWPAFTLATLITFNLIEIDSFLKDPLTKLSTRGKFETLVKYMLKRSKSFSVIMIDANDFKLINDDFGHKEGDEALITIASIITNSVKRYDDVCRYGGDEFMILIDSGAVDAAEKAVLRIFNSIEHYNSKIIKPYKLSLSYGSIYVDAIKCNDIKDLLAEVDVRMYRDKARLKEKGVSIYRN